MKRLNLIVPLALLGAFSAYFTYWKSQQPPPEPAETKSLDPYEGRNGRKEAEAEFAAGKLVLIEAAPPVSWDAERREIAREKYGLELRVREGDVSTEAFAKYADAFNRFMRPKVIAQHGRAVFDEIHREAIARYEARRGQSSGATTSTP